jgi:hypothetical protein
LGINLVCSARLTLFRCVVLYRRDDRAQKLRKDIKESNRAQLFRESGSNRDRSVPQRPARLSSRGVQHDSVSVVFDDRLAPDLPTDPFRRGVEKARLPRAREMGQHSLGPLVGSFAGRYLEGYGCLHDVTTELLSAPELMFESP